MFTIKKNHLNKKAFAVSIWTGIFLIAILLISRIPFRPMKQVWGGSVQRIGNPFIRYPSPEEEKINPVLNENSIPAIKRNIQSEKIARLVLKEYTWTARFQLESIPIGEFNSTLAGTHGKSVLGQPVKDYNGQLLGGGYNRGKLLQATYIRQDLRPQDQIKVLRHVLLHTAIVNAGGLDTKKFMQDFAKLRISDPVLYQEINRFIKSPFYKGASKSLLAEEIFAQLGAWEGSKIFHTPVGSYYKWILKEPSS